jgi:hypothetical protein
VPKRTQFILAVLLLAATVPTVVAAVHGRALAPIGRGAAAMPPWAALVARVILSAELLRRRSWALVWYTFLAAVVALATVMSAVTSLFSLGAQVALGLEIWLVAAMLVAAAVAWCNVAAFRDQRDR